MKKNNLIVEVDRIKEMMNLSILNEGIPDPIIKGMMKVVDDFALLNKGSLTKNFEPALKRVQDAFNSGNIPQFKKSLYRLIDMDDDLYDLLKSDIFKQNQKLIDSINKSIEDSLSRRPPLTKDEVKTKLNDYWRDQVFPNYPSRKFRDELMTQFNKKIDDFQKVIPPDQMTSSATKILSNLTGKDIQTVRRIIWRTLRSRDSLIKEFLQLQDEAISLMKDGKDPSFQLKKMVDVYASMKKWPKDSLSQIWENLSINGKQGLKSYVDPSVLQSLEDSGEKFNELLKMLRKGDTKVDGFFKEFDWKHGLKSLRLGKKAINLLLWGDWRSLSQISEFVAKKGFPRYLGGRIVTYFAVFPVIQAGLWTALYAGVTGMENIINSIGKLEGDEEWNAVDYNEGDDGWDTFVNELKKQYQLNDIWQFLDITMLDELFINLGSFFSTSNVKNGEDLEEQKQEAEEFLEKERKSYWNGLGNRGKNAARDAAEETGNPDLIDATQGEESSEETETSTEEQPLTFDPVLKDIFARYPCMKANFKNGDMKKISDTEFTIMGNGSKWTINIIDGNPFYTKQNGVSLKSAYGKDRIPVQCQE